MMEVNFHGTNLQPKLSGDNFIGEPAQHELRYFRIRVGLAVRRQPTDLTRQA